MPALETVVTWATLGLALGVAIVTLILRRLVEFFFPGLSRKTDQTRGQQFWEKLVLPTAPAFFCMLFCLAVPAKDFDYPTVAAMSAAARAVYGLVVGYFAAWAYAIITFLIFQKWQVPAPLAITQEAMAAGAAAAEGATVVVIPPPVIPPPVDSSKDDHNSTTDTPVIK